MNPPPEVDWGDLNGAWMLLREHLPQLLAVSGVDLKLGSELQTGVEAIDELFRRVNSAATLAAAAEPVEETEEKGRVIGHINSRDAVGES
ncbi:MAG: hypothetical protein BMS9Abin32_156 [Gammaproteobacteria bacterium]|nr:MAG: hypothetical protein BMS9Abin32_156 [Gammaproteobacteria bacterium]